MSPDSHIPAPGGWFERLGPSVAETPVVYAVPHAGRDYPAELIRDSAVPRAVLEGLEDRHADRLIVRAVAAGNVAIVARVARGWIDLNRGHEDLDPQLRLTDGEAPPSGRARAGLGLVPRRLGRRDLWRTPPDPASVARRLRDVHEPYHRAIGDALADALRRHGVAVLIDCHSMPPIAGMRQPGIVIGDLHGRSAARHVSRAALVAIRAASLPARLNDPYAGAYSLARHGRPRIGIHALQVEVDRTLYLLPGLREPSPDAAGIAALVHRVGETSADAARAPALAAE